MGRALWGTWCCHAFSSESLFLKSVEFFPASLRSCYAAPCMWSPVCCPSYTATFQMPQPGINHISHTYLYHPAEHHGCGPEQAGMPGLSDCPGHGQNAAAMVPAKPHLNSMCLLGAILLALLSVHFAEVGLRLMQFAFLEFAGGVMEQIYWQAASCREFISSGFHSLLSNLAGLISIKASICSA